MDQKTELRTGRAIGKGLEFMAHKSTSRYSLTLSYTLSEAKKKVEGVNNDNWYYAVYDQRHNLSINAFYNLNKTVDLSAAWRYHTGGRATLPTNTFTMWHYQFGLYSERNGYVLPDFHRLDLAFQSARTQAFPPSPQSVDLQCLF